ncbi:MAG: 50S ribosomal protein L4 [Clostridiales bacterium]|nr:50S ribosomal protein L4 [Clostridiales bacterium]
MPSIKVYNQKGAQTGELELDESVFGAEYNEGLIHQVVVAQANNARQGTKCTLTRTEVRGGGRKPWRQKGTGHARQGSIRAPQWIKGGVVFAPKPRDFSQKVNIKARRNALRSALSAKLSDGDMIAVDKFEVGGKTKEAAAILKALNIEKRVLIVVDGENEMFLRATNNIPFVRVLPAEQINVRELVANAKCIMTVPAIKKIEEAYKA